MVGQTISHYRILEKLGEGGMGVVYKAEDTSLRRTVALKFLSAHALENRDRLLREAQAAAALNHPCICTVFEIDEARGFLAMELIDGMSLKEKIAARPLPLAEAMAIAQQACAGLAAAHDKGIVHRDIKPANLMVTAQGQVKIMDFGLAQLGDRTRITKTGSSLGTPAYMSPEQARGEPLDHRTDLWSLGVTLYEMVTGRLPFRGDTEPSVVYSILNEQPEPPTALRSGLPLELDRLLRKALAKDREERCQNAADLLVDLRALRSGAAPATTPSPTSRKKSRLIAALAAAIAAAGLAAWSLVPRFGDPPLESLAVLPLKSLDRSPDDAPLELGMADTIITRLSQIGTLKVRPTSAVRKYASADSDAIRAAQELKVDAVLEGTLQRSGERLRVSVNLLRVGDGTSLWAESFSVPFSGIFEVQDEVSRQVASRLQGRLTATERDKLARRSTSNPDAYLAYAKAVYYFGNRGARPGKDPATENAIELLQQAVNLDPNFALAHAQLGYAYAWSAIFFEDNPSWIARAKKELEVAAGLDPNLAQVHVARSFIVWSQYEGFQAEEAIRELRLAQKIDPSAGLSELAGLYLHVGLEEETRRLRQRALDLDPNSELLKREVVIEYYLTARPDEGLAADKRFFNNGPGAHYYREKRMVKELRPLVEKAYSVNPEIPWDTGSPAHLLAFEGKHREAQAAMPGIMAKVRRNRSYHHAAFDAARIYALGGNAAEAVKWLQVAVETGFPNYPLFARDSFLDTIRKDPRFVAFMAREKAEWERRSREFR